MKIDGRLFIALIIALALIPGTCAVSFGGGTSIATTGGQAQGITVANNNAIASQGSFAGDFDYKNWLDDKKGKHVEEELHVDSGFGDYNFQFKQGNKIVDPDSVNHVVPASSSLSATLKLNVVDALGTSVNVGAQDGNGDKANSGINMGPGSLVDYSNSAQATTTSATSSQAFYSLVNDVGNVAVTTQASNLAGYNANKANSGINMGPGSLVDYSNSAQATTTSATSSQAFNYAWADDTKDITVQTNAIYNVKNADVSSTVKNGYVFLYDDKSTSSKQKTEASANVNAVGTIDVQYKTNTYGPLHLTDDVKLAASVDSVAGSNPYGSKPTATIYNGLAFMAVDRDAFPSLLDPLSLLGHVGVGVWNKDGTWTIGSLQGGVKISVSHLAGASLAPGEDNNGWSAHDLTWPEVQVLLSSSDNNKAIQSAHRVKGKVKTRDGFGDIRPGSAYDHIKLIRDNSYTSKPDDAKAVMDNFPNRGFWFGGLAPRSVFLTKPWSNDCLDAAVDALQAYGVPKKEDAPTPWSYTFPNVYFDQKLKDKNVLENVLKDGTYKVPYVNNAMVPAYYWMVNAGDLIQPYIDKATSGDAITIAPGLFDKENLVIDKSLTLKGAGNTESGTVVKGLGTDSVFTIGKVDPNIDVYLKDMLIRNGIGTLDSGYVLGGGILNKGTLTVDHCTIQNNGHYTSPWDSSPSTLGGGIYSSGDLTVTDSTISNNLANCGSGIYLDNSGKSPLELKAEITDSRISSNYATTGGGGIYNSGGDLTLTGSTISGNGGGYWRGGGIVNTGNLEMISGTISGNGASGNGGGVENYGTFTMKGGTISDNTASPGPAGTWYNGNGGGIYNEQGGILNLEGGSISGNHADYGGGVYNFMGTLNLIGGSISGNHASDGAGIYNGMGTLNLEGTSIIGNEAYNNGGGIFNAGSAIFKEGSSIFHNIADSNADGVGNGGGIFNTGTLAFQDQHGNPTTDPTVMDSIVNNNYLQSITGPLSNIAP